MNCCRSGKHEPMHPPRCCSTAMLHRLIDWEARVLDFGSNATQSGLILGPDSQPRHTKSWSDCQLDQLVKARQQGGTASSARACKVAPPVLIELAAVQPGRMHAPLLSCPAGSSRYSLILLFKAKKTSGRRPFEACPGWRSQVALIWWIGPGQLRIWP